MKHYSSRTLVYHIFTCGLLMLLKVGSGRDLTSTERAVEEAVIQRSNAAEDTCTTASLKSGSCIPMIRCRSYWGRGNVPDLTNATCSNETAARVCCPLADDDETTATFSSTITESTANVSVTTTVSHNNSNGNSWRKSPRSFPEDCGISSASFSRIIGGQDAALGAWPWMAAIYLVRRGIRRVECGGALITASHVVTAAHCTVTSRRGQTFSPRQLLVRLGELDLDSNGDGANPMDMNVRSIIKHERFSLRTFQNDIAILELEGSVSFNGGISPICLPFNVFQNDDLAERNAIVIGWGATRFGGPGVSRLQEVQLRIWSNEPCREVFLRDVPITDTNLCAGDGDKDACRGDSGGPLMLPNQNQRFYLMGIVSFGKRCAEPGVPGVYARVTGFLDWIEEKIG